MSKIQLLILILFYTSISANAQYKDPLDNGFGLKLHTSFYGDSDLTGYGLELTNQWYLMKFKGETMGLALLMGWLDVSAGFDREDLGTGVESTTLLYNVSLFELGPLYTYKIKADMGLDVYLQLRPTLFASLNTLVYDNGQDDEASGYIGLGASKVLGLGYRYKVFYVGLEFGFGNVRGVNTDEGNGNLEEVDLNTGNTRVSLGFKF